MAALFPQPAGDRAADRKLLAGTPGDEAVASTGDLAIELTGTMSIVDGSQSEEELSFMLLIKKARASCRLMSNRPFVKGSVHPKVKFQSLST